MKQALNHAPLNWETPGFDIATGLPDADAFRALVDHALLDGSDWGRQLTVVTVAISGIALARGAQGDRAADDLARVVTTRLACQLKPQNQLSRLSEGEFACVVVSPGWPRSLRTLAAMLSQALDEPITALRPLAPAQAGGVTHMAPVVIKSCEALLWAACHGAAPKVPQGQAWTQS